MQNKNVEIIPITLKKPLTPDDYNRTTVSKLLRENITLEKNDIVVVTSKIVSILEGRCISLSSVRPSSKAKKMARAYNFDAKKLELVLRESKTLCVIPIKKLMKNPNFKQLFFSLSVNGLSEEEKKEIIDQYSYVWISKKHGQLTDNAGIDKSNIKGDYVSLLPKDPKKSAYNILTQLNENAKKDIGVIITDTLGGNMSIQGHWDTPLSYAGIEPLEKKFGAKDIFGLIGTGGRSNYVIPIAAMAGLVMGSCDECTPMVVIRNHNCPISDNKEVVKGHDLIDIENPSKILFKAGIRTVFTTIGYLFLNIYYKLVCFNINIFQKKTSCG